MIIKQAVLNLIVMSSFIDYYFGDDAFRSERCQNQRQSYNKQQSGQFMSKRPINPYNESIYEIDSLSIMSKDKNNTKLSPTDHHHSEQISRSNFPSESHENISIQNKCSLESNNESSSSDMSMLVLEGLEIARRKSLREQQICSILPIYQKNINLMKIQLTELISMKQFEIIAEEQAQTTNYIKILQIQINRLKRDNHLKKGIKTSAHGRRYLSPNFGLIKETSQQTKQVKKVQELNIEIKHKKHEFLKNKIRYQQLSWQLEKLQRKSKIIKNSQKRQQIGFRTVSKKKFQHHKQKSNTRQSIRPFERSKDSLGRKNKESTPAHSGLSTAKYSAKMNQQYYCQDKSEFKGVSSSYTQEKTKKQLLLRRLKIVNESITLYQGTFSKIISQLQLQCKIFVKQLECIDDQISNSNNVDGSQLNIPQKPSNCYSVNNLLHPTPSDRKINENERQSGPRGLSQNLRTLASKKQRKLSSNFGSRQESSATYRKIRVSSAYDADSEQNKSNKIRKLNSNKYLPKADKKIKRKSQIRNLTPDTIKQNHQKKQNLIMEQYFQTEDYDEGKLRGRTSYSPQIIRKYY